jgi:hypothetical protein
VSAKSVRMPTFGPAGKALWSRLTEVYGFTPTEVQLLTMACRQADDLAKLDGAVKRYGIHVTGSMGQKVLNPALIEARLARQAIARLLGQLDLPNPEEKPQTAASRRASKAANKRWRPRVVEGEAAGGLA